MAELGSGLDLLWAEATDTVDHEGTPGHMSGRQAGDHRPWAIIDADDVADEAAAASGRPVEQAAIGKEFVL